MREQTLIQKRHDLQITYKQRLNNKKIQLEEDFEINKNILAQDNLRKKENFKIIMQSKSKTKLIENDIEAYKKSSDPTYKQQLIKGKSEVFN